MTARSLSQRHIRKGGCWIENYGVLRLEVRTPAGAMWGFCSVFRTKYITCATQLPVSATSYLWHLVLLSFASPRSQHLELAFNLQSGLMGVMARSASPVVYYGACKSSYLQPGLVGGECMEECRTSARTKVSTIPPLIAHHRFGFCSPIHLEHCFSLLY